MDTTLALHSFRLLDALICGFGVLLGFLARQAWADLRRRVTALEQAREKDEALRTALAVIQTELKYMRRGLEDLTKAFQACSARSCEG